jgi:hypothetical protein
MSDERNKSLPEIEELDFERDSVWKLYRSGSWGINPERWERVREAIRFEDVVSELTGHRDLLIRCPFHGRDLHPSFTLYPRTNDAFCFGCPPGQMYYDAVTFASKYLEINRVQALKWLEEKFDLPRISDVNAPDDDVDDFLTFWDLAESFICKASREIQETKDVELAEDYLCIYFTGLKLEKDATEVERGRGEDAANPHELHLKATLELAQVLGKEQLEAIAKGKEL